VIVLLDHAGIDLAIRDLRIHVSSPKFVRQFSTKPRLHRSVNFLIAAGLHIWGVSLATNQLIQIKARATLCISLGASLPAGYSLMRSFLAAALITILVLALPLSVDIASAATQLAQVSPPITTLPWSGLNKDDLDRMHAAAARLYEGRSIGSVERWRNPDNDDAGSVMLLRQFEAKGMPCSKIEYKLRLAETQQLRHYILDWCKMSSGAWKIVDLGPNS
jgi:hypothetical protein